MRKIFGKHIWTEPVAFNPKLPDFGVSAYISNCGFKPERISLLASCPDFIHLYNGKIDDTVLLREYCSYGGRLTSHRWTRKDLKRLIDELHDNGIPVWLSFVANLLHPQFERPSEWARAHPETIVMDKYGNTSLYPEGRFEFCFVNPLARFRDGTYYQEFFGKQLAMVLADYGYDGFHGADGYKSLIKTLEHADYSENIISQFEGWLGEKIPDPPKAFHGRSVTFKADLIWKHLRLRWIEFYCQRWAEFWKTVVGYAASERKGACANSAWNMGPVDAIQRFGIDYRRIYESGVREIYHEGGAGGVWSIYGSLAGPDSDKPGGWKLPWKEIFIDGNVSLLTIKAYVPEVKIFALTGTYDPFERTDIFHQLPFYVERDIFSQGQFYVSKDGSCRPVNCVHGMFEAIADKLEAHEWKWLNDRWDVIRTFHPARLPGPCLVWSERALAREIRDGEKHWGIHRLLAALEMGGLPVISAARIDNAGNGLSNLLILLNPEAFPENETERVLSQAQAGRPVAVIGRNLNRKRLTNNLRLVLRDYDSNLTMWLYSGRKNMPDTRKLSAWLKSEAARLGERLAVSAGYGSAWRGILRRRTPVEPYELTPEQTFHFLTRIPPERIPPVFMKLVAAVLFKIGWPEIKTITMKVGPSHNEPLAGRGLAYFISTGAKTGLIMVQNFTMRSLWVDITMNRRLKKVEPFGFYPMPPVSDGHSFDLRVPIQGAVLAKVMW